MSSTHPEPFDWREERLRYQVLRFIFDTVGSDCELVVTASQIGTALALGFDDVLRIEMWLDAHGYVHHLGGGGRVCLTARGIAYLEGEGGRRRSLRS